MIYNSKGKELSTNIHNVKTFGAKGDGITPDTNAINYVTTEVAQNGGIIYFPEGIYIITASILFKSNQTLLFENGATLKAGGPINNIMMNSYEDTDGEYSATNNVDIIGATFDGSTETTNITLLGFCHAQNIRVKNCTFKNAYGTWHNLEVNSSKNVLVENCDFEGSRKTSSSGCLIQLDAFNNAQTWPWGGLVDNTISKYVEIKGCHFHTDTVSPAIGNHSDLADEYVKIHDNIFDGLTNSRGAINFKNYKNVDVYDNTFNGCTTGAVVQNSDGTNIIHDNKFINIANVSSGFREYNNYINDNMDYYPGYSPIEPTLKGSPIVINDSSDNKISELKINGKSTQITTNGYQLLERLVSGTTYTSRGITFKFKDFGKIYITGTLTGTGSMDVWLCPNTTITEGTYYVKGQGFSSKVKFVMVRSGMPEQTGSFSQVLNLQNENTYPPKILISEGATNLNIEVQVMVESGTISHDYESYTDVQSTPRMDFPQNIMDITKEQITINRKNCIPLSEVSKSTIGIPTTATYQYDTANNEIVINTNSFEGTKEIIIGTYDLSDGVDQTSKLPKYFLMDVTEGSMPKFRTKNGVFTKPIPTFMDKNNKSIKTYTGSLSNNTLVVPKGAVKMGLRVSVENATGNTEYRDNIMITFDEDLLSDWESPSDNQTKTLTKILRGIKLDSNVPEYAKESANYIDPLGQHWICDTIEKYKDGTGKIIQRIARANTSTRAQITKIESSVNNLYAIRWNHTNTPSAPKPNYEYYTTRASLVERFLFKTNAQLNTGVEGFNIGASGAASWILKCGVTLDKLSTIEEFTEWINNNTFDIVYAIDTPIETLLTAEDLEKLDLSTYKPVTTIVSNPDVEVTYIADTKNYIDNKFAELQNAIVSQGGNV